MNDRQTTESGRGWDALAGYHAPDWFRDAKFGIFVHWGVMSVPEQSCWYARQMYMETGSYGGDAVWSGHRERYGHPSVFGFKDLIPQWRAERFDPDELVRQFRDCGARYVVAMAVHHDNFDNFDSTHQPWNSVNMGPRRDIVGDWKTAIERHGLRFGLSSHSDRAWQFLHPSHGSDHLGPLAGVPYDGTLTKEDGAGLWWAGYDPRDLYGRDHGGDPMAPDETYMQVGEEPDEPFRENWYLRTAELVERYEPDLLYFDGPLPFGSHGVRLAREFYEGNRARHGGRCEAVLNIKSWGPGTVPDRSAVVLDIEKGVLDSSAPFAWQTDTSILPDWIWTPQEHGLSDEVIVHKLCDIVSKNGNLLLNVSPRADGSLPQDQRATLRAVGQWLETNGEAMFETRPWRVFGEGPTTVAGGDFHESTEPLTAADIRFTCRPADNGTKETLYATVMGWPADGAVRISSLTAADSVELLGWDGSLSWSSSLDGVVVQLPREPVGRFAYVLRIRGHRSLFASNNTLAWAIVAYDDRRRGPAERVAMLRTLGLTQYAWDWREENLADLPAELALSSQAGVRLRAVWMWVDRNDSAGKLSAGNARVLTALNESERPVEIWLGFAPEVFDGLDPEACVELACDTVAYISSRAAESGSSVCLSNHGGWLGEPDHQLEVLACLGDPRVGMVYNFHHGQGHVEHFSQLLPRMLPHLRVVNVNGMEPGGVRVLPVGSGSCERELIRTLEDAGYTGALGVIGHVETADVEQVLRRNLDGLRTIAIELEGHA